MLHNWRSDQLACFSLADDLQISPFYSDGKTYGTPTWIWSVIVDNQLYVRAWNGLRSRWHRSAHAQGAGRIFLAGQQFEVIFETEVADDLLNQKVNEAYQRKYDSRPY